MNPEEFLRRLSSLPEEAPDAWDLQMIREAEETSDESAVPLDAFNRDLDENTELVELRISRPLLDSVRESARREGVSVNQYVLRRLSRPETP